MPANECIPFYDDGDEITVHAANALTGKRFAAITGRQSGARSGTGINAGLATSGTGGNYTADVPGAGVKAFGVVQYDVGSGEKVTLLKRKILPVTVGAGGVTQGAEVEVDNTGKVTTLNTGKAVGLCLVAASAAADAEILVY